MLKFLKVLGAGVLAYALIAQGLHVLNLATLVLCVLIGIPIFGFIFRTRVKNSSATRPQSVPSHSDAQSDWHAMEEREAEAFDESQQQLLDRQNQEVRDHLSEPSIGGHDLNRMSYHDD